MLFRSKPGYADLAREVAGKTVFIGVSSMSAGDYAFTPMGPISILRLSAIAYASLGESYVLTPPIPWVDGLLVIMALALGVLLLRRGADATPRHFVAAFTTLPLFFVVTGTLLFAGGGDAARFDTLYREYAKAPEVTRKRIYLETMGRILPRLGRKVVVDGNLDGLLPLLDLGGELLPGDREEDGG